MKTYFVLRSYMKSLCKAISARAESICARACCNAPQRQFDLQTRCFTKIITICMEAVCDKNKNTPKLVLQLRLRLCTPSTKTYKGLVLISIPQCSVRENHTQTPLWGKASTGSLGTASACVQIAAAATQRLCKHLHQEPRQATIPDEVPSLRSAWVLQESPRCLFTFPHCKVIGAKSDFLHPSHPPSFRIAVGINPTQQQFFHAANDNQKEQKKQLLLRIKSACSTF